MKRNVNKHVVRKEKKNKAVPDHRENVAQKQRCRSKNGHIGEIRERKFS